MFATVMLRLDDDFVAISRSIRKGSSWTVIQRRMNNALTEDNTVKNIADRFLLIFLYANR